MPIAASAAPSSKPEHLAAKINAIFKAEVRARQPQLTTSEQTLEPVTSDAEFVRRVYLTLAGRIPKAQEAAAFLDSKSSKKRSQLISQLSRDPALNGVLFTFYADLLRVDANSEFHGLGWHYWLRDAVEKNMPYNLMVRHMLNATGAAAENPAVGYYLRDRGMVLDNVANTARVFLGQQIGCAQCHDHPFDDFSQKEFYELAAHLGGSSFNLINHHPEVQRLMQAHRNLTRKEGRKARKNRPSRELRRALRNINGNAIYDASKKKLKYPKDYAYEDATPGQNVTPAFPFRDDQSTSTSHDRRGKFADWVTALDNPFFAKVIANRLWEQVFGYGLAPNSDDWSGTSPDCYPKTLAALENLMKDLNYDVRAFYTVLCHLDLFQRKTSATLPQPGFAFTFRGPALQRLSANQLHDSWLIIQGKYRQSPAAGRPGSSTWESYQTYFQQFVELKETELPLVLASAKENDARSRKLNDQLRPLRQAARKAREDGDKQKARQLQQEIKNLQKDSRRLGETDMAASMMSRMSPGVTEAAAGRIESLGNWLLTRRPQLRRESKEKRQDFPAADLLQPARPNSLLRQFGSSDRRTPMAAHTEATIPQVLRLLNGSELTQLARRPGKKKRAQFRNDLMIRLNALNSPEARLRHLFLTFYSALPTEQEKETFLSLCERPADLQILVRALVTTNRFLFLP